MLVISNAFLIMNLSMSPFIYHWTAPCCNVAYIIVDSLNEAFLDIACDKMFLEYFISGGVFCFFIGDPRVYSITFMYWHFSVPLLSFESMSRGASG